MIGGRSRLTQRTAGLLLACLLLAACSRISVDSIRLTAERYPPRRSAAQIELLAQAPGTPFREVAELTVRQRHGSLEALQERLREEAAKLGADAVLLGDDDIHIKTGIAYQPVYNPWGRRTPYYGPFSGPYGYGYGGLGFGRPYGYVAVPYEVEIVSLRGVAIRYVEAAVTLPSQ